MNTYASIELNLDVKDKSVTKQVEEILTAIIANDCILITKEKHRKSRNIFRQFYRWLSYEAIRVIFYFITFYYRQETVR